MTPARDQSKARRVAPDPLILAWTERLTGYPPDVVRDGRSEIKSWRAPKLERELVERVDVDAAVGAAMLVQAVRELTDLGVPLTKLVSKLRGDNQVWPAWSEICAAASIARQQAPLELRMEEDRSLGRHADLRLVDPSDQSGASIEFKALGLSDEEVDFYREARPVLATLLPRRGAATLHTELGTRLRAPSRSDRRELEKESRAKLKRILKPWGSELRAAVIVGHVAEQAYLERMGQRILTAIGQLPAVEESWVALWWTNGAPVSLVGRLFEVIELPAHIAGVILVGAGVAIPDSRIHHYNFILPAGADPEDAGEFRSLESEAIGDIGQLVMKRFERSSGLRPTLMSDPSLVSAAPVLDRDGSRRWFPFNLLIDEDPPPVRSELRTTDLEGDHE
jgi:hypothetical protein